MPVDRVVLETKPKGSNCLKKVPSWDTVVQCTFLARATNMEEELPQMQPNHKNGWRKQMCKVARHQQMLPTNFLFFFHNKVSYLALVAYDGLFNGPTLVSRDILGPAVRVAEKVYTRPFTTVVSYDVCVQLYIYLLHLTCVCH